jgi:hypothetical protein
MRQAAPSTETPLETPPPVLDLEAPAEASAPPKKAVKPKRADRWSNQRCFYCYQMTMDRQDGEDIGDFLLSLISAYPFRCRRCLRTDTKFFLSFRPFLVVIFIFGISFGGIFGVGWLYQHRPSTTMEGNSHQEAADGVRSNMGQLSPFEKMMLSKHQQTLDNETILKLSKSNLGTPIIIKMMRSSNHDFDVSANAIIALKEAGVDEAIIFTMLDLSSDPR